MLSNCTSPANFKPTKQAAVGSGSVSRVYMKCNVFSNPGIIGSSYIQIGGTKFICCVICPITSYKPRLLSSVDSGEIECNIVYPTYAQLSSVDVKAMEISLSTTVREVMESAVQLDYYPKQRIEVRGVVLQSSSCDLTSAINGVGLALADASVRMIDLPCSSSVIFDVSSSDTLPAEIVSESHIVQNNSSSQIVHLNITAFPALGTVTYCHMQGRVAGSYLVAAQSVAMERCKSMRELMGSALRDKT
mmetsp:Transcript_32738/g.55198  ORF Transcript_32738/g.55198 Transcript_32738/m.55198 type:complete len:247 (+) Transcript_32738:1-741(+)